jgi:hypothetical protein
VRSDASPDDVGCAGREFVTVFERRPTIWRPRHFEDAGGPLNPPHSQTVSKDAIIAVEIVDELLHGNEDRRRCSGLKRAKSTPNRADQA